MLTIKDIDLCAIDAVVFDLDGTLYDKHGLPRRLMLGEIGRWTMFARERIARKVFRGMSFGSQEAFEKAFFSKMGCGVACWQKWAQRWYNNDYMPLMVDVLEHHYMARPWVGELLKELHKAGKKVAVYSDYGCVEQKLRALGLPTHLFDLVVSAPELGGLKPAKESMMKVLSMLEIPAERCLMVGDRDDTDGESARAVGAQFLQVK